MTDLTKSDEPLQSSLASFRSAEPVVLPSLTDEIPLWQAGDVEDNEVAFRDPGGGVRVRNVTVPTLTPYLPHPSLATGAAVVVAPGGGFYMLSMDNEGTEVAEWLRQRGVAAFVLKYRLAQTGPSQSEFVDVFFSAMVAAQERATAAGSIADTRSGHQRLAVDDTARAVAMVRERAMEWRVDVDRVGAIGFSAGAYAVAAALRQVSAVERPDSLACIYGGYVSAAELPEAIPPMFAAVGAHDRLCAADVLDLVQAWRARSAPVEAHIYDSSAHGFGVRPTGTPVDEWLPRYEEWLVRLGYARRP